MYHMDTTQAAPCENCQGAGNICAASRYPMREGEPTCEQCSAFGVCSACHSEGCLACNSKGIALCPGCETPSAGLCSACKAESILETHLVEMMRRVA